MKLPAVLATACMVARCAFIWCQLDNDNKVSAIAFRTECCLMSYCTSDAKAKRRKGIANRFPGRRRWVMDSASQRSGGGRRLTLLVYRRVSHWSMRRRASVRPSVRPSRLYHVAVASTGAELRCLSVSSWWPVCRPTRISDGYWLLVGWCPAAAAEDVYDQVYHWEHSAAGCDVM